MGKKEGQGWLVDFASLQRSGLIKVMPAEKVEVAANHDAPPPPDTRTAQKSEKGRASPSELSAYKNLLDWRTKAHSLLGNPAISALVLEAQKHLAAGYFEFSRARKADFYRNVRNTLAHLWVELDNLGDGCPERLALQQFLAADVIGSISGVLRKMEQKTAPAPGTEP